MLYQQQDSLGIKPFASFARESGVRNIDAFTACAGSTSPDPIIDRDKQVAAAIGGTGTPTLVINGARLRGAPDSLQLDLLVSKMVAALR